MRATKLFILFCLLIFSLFHQHAYAQGSTEVDESFDPFSDYNEFEQDADEEADINFFKNGRMLTMGLQFGYRAFTDGFSQAYTPNLIYGFQFTYFFDLQTSLGINYATGDHNVSFTSYNDEAMTDVSNRYSGSVNLQTLDVSFKYFFNTENVTRGLADLNPYMSFGAAYFIRTYNINMESEIPSDKVFGAKAAVGIEIPLLRRRAFLGFQGTFNYVQFPDENKLYIEEAKETEPDGFAQSPVSPRFNGDLFDVSAILGVNF